jgi:hypothetical protein
MAVLMKIALRMLCCSVFLLQFTVAWADTSYPDGSLTEEEYYQKGIPRVIESLEDYDKALVAFRKIAKEDCGCLPRYNSDKSKAVFNLLFSKRLPDEIAQGDLLIVERRQILSELQIVRGFFIGEYLICNKNHIYDNEHMRLHSLSVHIQLLLYELMEAELLKNNLDFADAVPDPQEKILLLVRGIHRDMWAMDYYPNKALKNLDDETKSEIKRDEESYKKRILAIKFLDYENNVKKLPD